MTKREEERRQADQYYEQIRRAVAEMSNSALCESLREIPHRKWLQIEKDTRMSIGIVAHVVASRLEKMEQEAAIANVVWKFIDRMGDIDPQYDPAEKILNEFYSAVHPFIEAALPKQEK